MKYSIHIHFTNGEEHAFLFDCDTINDVDDLFMSYSDDKSRLIDAQDIEKPMLFNPDSVVYIVAVECEEINSVKQFREEPLCL